MEVTTNKSKQRILTIQAFHRYNIVVQARDGTLDILLQWNRAKYGMSAATISGIHNLSPPKRNEKRKEKQEEELCGLHEHELHSTSRHEAFYILI